VYANLVRKQTAKRTALINADDQDQKSKAPSSIDQLLDDLAKEEAKKP
jgi:hypothetical protein